MGRIWCITFIVCIFLGLSRTIALAQSKPVYSPKVLLIGIDPTDSNGNSLANTYFSTVMGGQNSYTFEANQAQQTIADFTELSHGRIQYQLAGHLHLTSFPTYPNGYQFTVQNYSQCVWGRPEYNPTQCDTQKWLFPYVEYLRSQQICEKAEAMNADEIWIYSPPYLLAYEAFMIGPNAGFWVNGSDYTVSGCTKHLIVVNGTYDRPDLFLHSYGHRIEFSIDYLMRNFSSANQMNYWERFAARNTSTRTSGNPFCGNVHFPFNYQNEYDVSSTENKISTCPDFANFPSYSGEQSLTNCSAWGCTDRGWEKYWMSFIPHSDGTVSITNTMGLTYAFKKDWWYYLLYPENAIRSETGEFHSPSPSATASSCVEDINLDSFVDLSDYSVLVQNFLRSPIANQRADINRDGTVDLSDYTFLVRKFLTHC